MRSTTTTTTTTNKLQKQGPPHPGMRPVAPHAASLPSPATGGPGPSSLPPPMVMMQLSRPPQFGAAPNRYGPNQQQQQQHALPPSAHMLQAIHLQGQSKQGRGQSQGQSQRLGQGQRPSVQQPVHGAGPAGGGASKAASGALGSGSGSGPVAAGRNAGSARWAESSASGYDGSGWGDDDGDY